MWQPKRLEKKLIADNWYFYVYETIFESKWKKWTILSMAKHNPTAVVVMPITKDKKIIYISEYRIPLDKNVIWFPAWSADFENYEEIIDIAKRELEEESWYSSNTLIPMWHYIQNVYIEWNIYAFLALDCKKIWEQNLDFTEDIEVYETSIEEFEKMLDNNEIHSPWEEAIFRKAKSLTNNFTNFDIW